MFFFELFSASGILSYLPLLLGLSGTWILYFILIGVSEVFFILFLRGILILSDDSIDTLAQCPDIPERPGLSPLT